MKSQIKTIALFGAFAAGFCFPQAAALNGLTRYLIALMMFFSLLNVRSVRHPLRREHWLIFFCNLLLGILPWGLLRLAGNAPVAEAAFFTGITPTATAASAVTIMLGGRAEFVLAAFLITNIGMAVLLPVLIPLVIGAETSGLFLHVAGSLCFVLGIPLAAVLLFRKFVKNQEPLLKISVKCAFYIWVAAIFLIIANAADFLYSGAASAGDVWLIASVSCLLCILGFLIGRIIGGKRYFLESSQSLGQKNTTLTIYLALTYASPATALGPAFYVIWHNSWNAIQLWQKTRRITGKNNRRKTDHV